MWLNLLVGNQQKHEDVTMQMGALASEVKEAKSAMLTKLEVKG